MFRTSRRPAVRVFFGLDRPTSVLPIAFCHLVVFLVPAGGLEFEHVFEHRQGARRIERILHKAVGVRHVLGNINER